MPVSHIQIVVGIISVRVTSSVPVLSNESRLVPDLAAESIVGELEVGGHMACPAFINCRNDLPF